MCLYVSNSHCCISLCNTAQALDISCFSKESQNALASSEAVPQRLHFHPQKGGSAQHVFSRSGAPSGASAIGFGLSLERALDPRPPWTFPTAVRSEQCGQ